MHDTAQVFYSLNCKFSKLIFSLNSYSATLLLCSEIFGSIHNTVRSFCVMKTVHHGLLKKERGNGKVEKHFLNASFNKHVTIVPSTFNKLLTYENMSCQCRLYFICLYSYLFFIITKRTHVELSKTFVSLTFLSDWADNIIIQFISD